MPKQNTLSSLTSHNGGKLFHQSNRIVLKLGSALLVDKEGLLSSRRVSRIVNLIIKLRDTGKEVILISSGAVVASKVLRNQVKKSAVFLINGKPSKKGTSLNSSVAVASLSDRQAYSAIGQVYLMEKYRRAFMAKGCLVGQVLVSKFSINHRPSYLNARNTINTLLRKGVIPIINENDPLATEEFRFGENDILGALVAGLIDADLYVIFSLIEGVYPVMEKNKGKSKSAKTAELADSTIPHHVYSILSDLSPEFMKQFKTTTSVEGSGGIVAKLEAARLANQLGIPTLIKNGDHANLFASLSDTSGTLVLSNKVVDLSARKRWLISQVTPKGNIVIDDGAVAAIQKGKSLLPGGIVSVHGVVSEGDVCNIVNHKHKVLARGMSNYSTDELNLIKGHKSSELEKILGRISHTEVIHRDNLALWN